jgi:hypothetical protein
MFATSNIRALLPSTQHPTCLQHRNSTSAAFKINVCNIQNMFKIVATSATFENK